MNHLRGKFVTKPIYNLSIEEEKKHKEYLLKILYLIDDYIILKQRKMSVLKKLHVLNIKYKQIINNQIIYKNGNYTFNGLVLNQNE